MNGGNDLIYRNERKTIAFNRDLARRRIPVTATPLGVTHQPMNLYQSNSATQQPQPPIATRQEEDNLAAPPLPPIVLSIDPSQSSLQSSQSTVMEETATFYGTLPVPAVTVDPQDDPALDEMSRQASVRLEQNSVDGRKLDLHV
uniref:Uncharacterized protein n=1 Tax=Aureoumbra lagunensis TaxID=44058 RepID=A0A7S3K0G7_9STRA